VLKLLNSIFSSFNNYVEAFSRPDTAFLLGGYSWFQKEFFIDTISYNRALARFEHRECKRGIGNFGKVAFVGDWAGKAQHELYSRLRARYGDESISARSTLQRKFGYEPFEVVRDLLRAAGPNDSIGGAPQIVTVSQHMNSRHVALHWPRREGGKIFIAGRPVFDFEKLENWILDPDTFETSHQSFVRNSKEGVRPKREFTAHSEGSSTGGDLGATDTGPRAA
jgi:hypothetical protein